MEVNHSANARTYTQVNHQPRGYAASIVICKWNANVLFEFFNQLVDVDVLPSLCHLLLSLSVSRSPLSVHSDVAVDISNISKWPSRCQSVHSMERTMSGEHKHMIRIQIHFWISIFRVQRWKWNGKCWNGYVAIKWLVATSTTSHCVTVHGGRLSPFLWIYLFAISGYGVGVAMPMSITHDQNSYFFQR